MEANPVVGGSDISGAYIYRPFNFYRKTKYATSFLVDPKLPKSTVVVDGIVLDGLTFKDKAATSWLTSSFASDSGTLLVPLPEKENQWIKVNVDWANHTKKYDPYTQKAMDLYPSVKWNDPNSFVKSLEESKISNEKPFIWIPSQKPAYPTHFPQGANYRSQEFVTWGDNQDVWNPMKK